MPSINIIKEYNHFAYPGDKAIKAVIKKAKQYLKVKQKFIINIVLVDNQAIKKFNFKYRKIDDITDVLSFQNDLEGVLGDIIISLEQAYEQAQKYQHSFERELVFLALHGFLHCLGYDHENKDSEAQMINIQKQIMNQTIYKR